MLYTAAGLVKTTEATCKGCHNDKSPTFKGFDCAAAMTAIKHWGDEAPADAPAAESK